MKSLQEFLVGALLIGSVVFLTIWGVGALATGEDMDYWEQVNNDCYVHVTKVNDAMWTRGHSSPEIRTIYCESTLEGVK